MQTNTPYALHDSDGSQPLRWAAHVRLTPELLYKLRHAPAQVSLRLNASSSSAANGQPSKNKTSVLSVLQQQSEAEADAAAPVMEQYELLSFREDPRVNHVCTFRRESAASSPSSGGGYAIYKTGVIHQKLIVQRLLDATEKDRMKDRHAKSVLDSRARSSKLLEQQPPETKKRRIAVLETTKRGPAKTAPMKANGISAELPKLTLRSALTAEKAQQTRERIEKGVETTSLPVSEATAVSPSAAPIQTDTDSQHRPTSSARQPDSTSAILFSSDSEKEVEESAPAKVKPVARPADDSAPVSDEKKTEADARVSPAKKTDHAEKPASAQGSSSPLLLPIPRKSLSEAPETKRPRPRSNLLPDLSFLPPVVQDICKRLARQIPRSAIVDQADYDTFVRQYETYRGEWELLDKAYSIEVIKASKRKEGLAFVQESMAMLQKMLAHIQLAIAKYERKLEAAASVQ